MKSQPLKQSSTGQKVFQHASVIPTSLEALVRFHELPDALRLLTPPPLIVKIVKDERLSNTQGTVDFILWFGPIPVRWIARHEPGPIATSFIDRMLMGPLAAWEHQHIFHAVEGGAELLDKVTFSHRRGWRGWLTRLIFDGLALKFLFRYRHWRTRRECAKLAKLP